MIVGVLIMGYDGIYNSDHDAWICVNMDDLSGIYGLSNKEKGWKMLNR